MDIVVRMYESNDLDKVNEILREAFDREKKEFNDDSFIEIVSLCDGEVSGYLYLTKVFNPIKNIYYCLVDYVCVSSKYRGTGTSDELIKYATKVSKEMGASYMQLTCSPFRKSAHKLYERNGFKIAETDLFRKELL